MNQRIRFLILILALLITFSACSIVSKDFENSKTGTIAAKFFPKEESLTDIATTEFEHRKNLTYDGYYLQICFSSAEEYHSFLKETETTYADMTEQQRVHSYFIINNVRFVVEDFSFRAIDMEEFGQTDEPYVGLIANCDSTHTVVFMYCWHEFAGIETIEIGLNSTGYMSFYADFWDVDSSA